MGTRRFYFWLLVIQAVYILITAIWPIVHVESFMEVTGYKTDVWLVKTVGALLIPVGLTLLSFSVLQSNRKQAALLGATTAFAFACVDFYYALTDVISDIYLADAIVQLMFLASWLFFIQRVKPDA